MQWSKEPVLVAWSGGKESLMVLRELHRQKDVEVSGLIATLCDDDQTATMHGVSRDILQAQADALGLPLRLVFVPRLCCQQTYNDHLSLSLAACRDEGIRKVAFADLFLDDLRDYREECLDAIGMEAIFPLWQMDTKELSWSFVNARYKAVITSVAEQSLPRTFAGRFYDRNFLADLPLDVDPCGENGEFHTFVYDGPMFEKAVAIKLGKYYTDATSKLYVCEIVAPQPQAPMQALKKAR